MTESDPPPLITRHVPSWTVRVSSASSIRTKTTTSISRQLTPFLLYLNSEVHEAALDVVLDSTIPFSSLKRSFPQEYSTQYEPQKFEDDDEEEEEEEEDTDKKDDL